VRLICGADDVLAVGENGMLLSAFRAGLLDPREDVPSVFAEERPQMLGRRRPCVLLDDTSSSELLVRLLVEVGDESSSSTTTRGAASAV